MRDLVDEYYSTGGEPNLDDVGGIAAGVQHGRCEWCGDYTRTPCGCAAETEIERLRTENERMGAALSIGSPQHVGLWDAINALVEASGGRNTVSTKRMTAVAGVERALRAVLAQGREGCHQTDRRSNG